MLSLVTEVFELTQDRLQNNNKRFKYLMLTILLAG